MVLFDEIEKAHPEVFNILLQIMDDGRLTDGHGRTIDFKNTVIIMTSNVGTAFFSNHQDLTTEQKQESLLNELKKYFKPEFINRIDDIVIFNFLDRVLIKKIVDIQIDRLNKILAEQKIKIELTDKAKDFLSWQGYEPDFGARPLKRAIQKYIQNTLSLKLLDGEFSEGDIIKVDWKKDESLDFEKIGEMD